MLSFLLDPGVLASLLSIVPFLGFGLVSTSNGEVIQTESILEGIKRVKLPQGRYEELELDITADNQSGEAVTFADLGSARLLRDGDDQYQSFDTLDRLAQIHAEFTDVGPTRDVDSGGTSTLRTKISQRLPLIAPVNALHVPSDENATLVLDFDSTPGGSSGLNGLANSGQVQVIGYKNPAVAEQRAVRYERTQPQFAGSGEQEIKNVTGQNVAFIFISDPDDVLEEVTLTRLMPGGLSDEDVWDGAPIDRVQRRFTETSRDFGASSLYGIMVPASPATQDVRNLGVDLELKASGATSDMKVQYARVTDPVPTGSAAGVQQRGRTLSRA
jgi:hypothetical protein